MRGGAETDDAPPLNTQKAGDICQIKLCLRRKAEFCGCQTRNFPEHHKNHVDVSVLYV